MKPDKPNLDKQRCVKLSNEHWQLLGVYGDGNCKQGIVRLIEYAKDSGFIQLTKGKK